MRAVLLMILFLPLSLMADERGNHYDRVTISVERQLELANELMQVELAVELERDDPAGLAEAINQTMAWALERVRSVAGVEVQSGSYSSYPVHNQGRQIGWRGSQTLRLESGDTARLSALVGALQQRLVIKSTRFTISDATRQRADAELATLLVAAFSERAELVSRSLKARSYRLVELALGDPSGVSPPPQRFMEMARSTMATPVAVESGRTVVTARASGVIELQR